jgi:glutamine synthetase
MLAGSIGKSSRNPLFFTLHFKTLAISRAGEMDFTMQVGPECEFFLFYTDEEGYPTLKTHDRAGYLI